MIKHEDKQANRIAFESHEYRFRDLFGARKSWTLNVWERYTREVRELFFSW